MSNIRSLTPRQQERRDRILECTRQQVARLGYDGVNMRDLAVEANVSTATLYNLYNSKDDLILVALQDLLGDIRTSVDHVPEGLDHLIARYEESANVIIENPRYADAMGRMLFAAEPSAPIVQQLIAVSRDQVMADLVAMQSAGELDEAVDIERLARDVSANTWSAILLMMKGFVALHDFKEIYVGTIARCLLPWLKDELVEVMRQRTGLLR